MTLPNFLIVGAAKSGTTSLFAHLAQHPDIYVPVVKEPCFFTEQGATRVATTVPEYEALFAGRTAEKAIGEASTTYLYDADAPRRIAALLGDRVKIIIMLRNPAERAYSLWGHYYYQVGLEKLPFPEALRAEEERIASPAFNARWTHHHGNYRYFSSGLYYEQVKRYLDIFGPDRVLVHIFEEFSRNPGHVCRKTFEFLGVDPSFEPVLEKQNVSPGFRSSLLQRILVHRPAFVRKVYGALPMRLKVLGYRAAKLIYWLNQQHTPRPRLDPALKAALLQRYLEDIHKLERLLGRDLSLWYASS